MLSRLVRAHATAADGQVCILNAVLRAAGRQALGAKLHAFVMWGLGLPAAYVLAFKLELGVLGERTRVFKRHLTLPLGRLCPRGVAHRFALVGAASWILEQEASDTIAMRHPCPTGSLPDRTAGLWLAPAGCTLLQAFVFHAVVGTWDWDKCAAAAQQLLVGQHEHEEFTQGLLDFETGGQPSATAAEVLAEAALDLQPASAGVMGRGEMAELGLSGAAGGLTGAVLVTATAGGCAAQLEAEVRATRSFEGSPASVPWLHHRPMGMPRSDVQ